MNCKIQVLIFITLINYKTLASNKTRNTYITPKKNFIVMRIGGGLTGIMNDITYSKHDKYNKYIDNIPILSQIFNLVHWNSNFHYYNIIKDIKEHGLSYLLSNINVSCDFIYNKHMFKTTYFSFGISFRYTNKIITDTYLKNLRIYLKELNNSKKSNDDEIDKENYSEKRELLKERIFEENNLKKCFENLNGNITNNYYVNKFDFVNFGGNLGLTILLGNKKYEESFFISLFIFLRYRKLLSFTLAKKGNENEYISIENKFLRINPFDISLGFEFGKANIISILFEIGVTSMLMNTNYTHAYNYYSEKEKNRINLRDITISIRYNKF